MAKKEWKEELDAVKKHIDNPYIYHIWENYSFPNKFKGRLIELNSNINVYEACFLSQLVNTYIKTYKIKRSLNILEVGLAYGTSTLTIINKARFFEGNVDYDIIDLQQTNRWEKIGIKHIEEFLKETKTKNVYYTVHEEFSTKVIPSLNKFYDIIFIDGGHSTDVVLKDLINSHEILLKNGLMILDDVKHPGVKAAILKFNNSHIKKYYRVIYVSDHKFIKIAKLYQKRFKRSFDNPDSMFCLQKII